jgi:hypothetical protein
MAESLFDKLESEAFRKGIKARSKEANTWFYKKTRALGKLGMHKILKDKRLVEVPKAKIGDMVMYHYDPAGRLTLPYYDAFPLIIVVGPAKKGFYGLNLHYLPPKVRAIFLDKLSTIANNSKYDETTKLKISYNLLKSTKNYKYFKPCFKHYLNKQVDSNIMKVEASEWNIAIFLQTESFKKAGKTKVWADSRSKY